jgi:hypothetical protein
MDKILKTTTDEIQTIKHGTRETKNELAGLNTHLIREMRQQIIKKGNLL